MPTFKSGAFAQQCFSSHPHSLTFKAFTLITAAITPSLSPDDYLTHPAPGPPRGAVPPVGRVPGPRPESAKTDTVPVYRVVVTCNACDMRHRFVIQTLTARLGQREENDTEAMSQLSCCATAHHVDLRVSSMDVINDSVGLRCGECDRAYRLSVSAMETYQK
jgi:RNase P subunit RPR2